MGKILECSSKGDKRFSAFYARIKYYDFVGDDFWYFIYTIFALILGIIVIFVSVDNIIQISIKSRLLYC
ncbi:TPA: hypothetical protein N2D16_002799 [Clostridium botulinum]|nr:hypothetical protein [Clostridium botulinum]